MSEDQKNQLPGFSFTRLGRFYDVAAGAFAVATTFPMANMIVGRTSIGEGLLATFGLATCVAISFTEASKAHKENTQANNASLKPTI